MKKELILLRGAPGSGKSYIAQQLKKERNAHVFCNDDLLTDENGVHTWTQERSLWAHHENQRTAISAMRESLTPIVIDNPALRPFVSAPYVKVAKHYNYDWDVIEPDTAWARDLDRLVEIQINTHHVPYEQLKSYLETWNKIKLNVFKAMLSWETAMDPEISLRFATVCLERGEKFPADEALIEYRDWRKIEGYEPEGGDELAARLEEKLEDWRRMVYNLRGDFGGGELIYES